MSEKRIKRMESALQRVLLEYDAAIADIDRLIAIGAAPEGTTPTGMQCKRQYLEMRRNDIAMALDETPEIEIRLLQPVA